MSKNKNKIVRNWKNWKIEKNYQNWIIEIIELLRAMFFMKKKENVKKEWNRGKIEKSTKWKEKFYFTERRIKSKTLIAKMNKNTNNSKYKK